MISYQVYVKGLDKTSQNLNVDTFGVDGQSKLQSVYGLASQPYEGCVGTKIYSNVDRESSSVLVDNPNVPVVLDVAEVAVFCPITSAYVHFKNNGDIVIQSNGKVTVNASNTIVNTTNATINATTSITATSPLTTLNTNALINGSLIVIDPVEGQKINTTI